LGGEKCGSTWLQHIFDTNPHFCLYPDDQETHFFTRHYEKGIGHYQKMFSHRKPGQISVDADPQYFSKPDVLERIERYVIDFDINAKFIFSAREPLARIESAYKMIIRRDGFKPLDTELETGSYIENSSYHKHLTRFMERFPKENFCLILYDDIQKNPDRVIDQLETFLDLPAGSLTNLYKNTRINAGGMRRSSALTRMSQVASKMVRSLNSPTLLHAIKRNSLVGKFQAFNSVEYHLSQEEKLLLESRRGEFTQEVLGLAELMNCPELPGLWGYDAAENQ
tara:strand:+ start:78244 stop:79086 length:843 start_codon:yes stop_codon:yes gene_type:complete